MKATKAAKKKSAPSQRFNLKVTGDSDPKKCQRLLSGLRGVQSVVQTFPDEQDEELKRLFVLDIDLSRLASALKELRHRDEVEYVESAPKRKLIR